MKRQHMIVSGKIQGVFYRDYVRREAEKRQITGWVMNMQNGTVEILAEGSDSALAELQKACRKGPLMAHIEDIKITESTATEEFEDFDIHYHDDI